MKRRLKRFQKPQSDYMYILSASLREELSPFVFFNSGTLEVNDNEFLVPMHPHSGIGIITYFDQGTLHHKNSSGIEAYIEGGGAQWINAGGGTYHEERHKKKAQEQAPWKLSMYQLWMPLPPNLEEGPVEYSSYQPKDFPVSGSAKVLTGSYNGVTSPLKNSVQHDLPGCKFESRGNFFISISSKTKLRIHIRYKRKVFSLR